MCRGPEKTKQPKDCSKTEVPALEDQDKSSSKKRKDKSDHTPETKSVEPEVSEEPKNKKKKTKERKEVEPEETKEETNAKDGRTDNPLKKMKTIDLESETPPTEPTPRRGVLKKKKSKEVQEDRSPEDKPKASCVLISK